MAACCAILGAAQQAITLNGRMRDKLLTERLFDSLHYARSLVAA